MPGVYSYDLVPLGGASVPSADCRRIEALSRLFGLTPASPARARILELGCGTAANLIPLALEFPETRFIGCDLSRRALAAAQNLIDGLGIANVELRHTDICDVDDGWGGFDYILCHDVFSWVAPRVREKILAIQSRHLGPGGVGYLSFDALPGWRLHGIARDLMRYHAAGLTEPRQAVARARAALAMAAAVQDQNPGAYAELLREEYFAFSKIGDEHLYHWVFSEHHEPFYFQEFVRLIHEAGLQFLADTDVARLFGPREPEEVRAFLGERERLEQQQYFDFLSNCTWRGVLVCHREVPIRSRPDEEVLRDCWLSRATPARGELAAPNRSIQEALAHLEERRPEFVAFDDLVEAGSPPAKFLLDAFAAGMVDVTLSPPRISSRIGDQPKVSPLVRLQARDGSIVTNQKNESVRLTELARHVATLLDGVRHKNAVVESVAREIHSGRLADDWTVRLQDDAPDAERFVESVLRYLRDHALLVA